MATTATTTANLTVKITMGQGPNHQERRRSNDRGRERLGKSETYSSDRRWEDERE